MKTKILSILALLLMTVTQGAWAQTTADIGRVIAADGKMYKTVTLANKVSTASGVVAYVNPSGGCYALSLTVATNGGSNAMVWGSGAAATGSWIKAYTTLSDALGAAGGVAATDVYVSYHNGDNGGQWTAATVARNYSTARPSGASAWSLPSAGDWNKMLKALAGTDSDISGSSQAIFSTTSVSSKLTAAGAVALTYANFWTSTEGTAGNVWTLALTTGGGYMFNGEKSQSTYTFLRPFFTFASASNGYVVEYNANGGSGAPAAQSKTHGTALTLSSTVPTRTGYTFAGWATSAEGPVAYSAGGSYTTNDDIVLYAQWNAIPTYTATFATGSGDTGWTIDPASGAEGATVTVSYTGENKVKSVTVKAIPTVTLSKTALDFDVDYYKGSTQTFTVTRDGDGAITATSSNTDVATVSVDGNAVTVTRKYPGEGSAVITVSVAATESYAAAANQTVNVTFSSMSRHLGGVEAKNKGWFLGADGYVYPSIAAATNADTEARAVIAHVGAIEKYCDHAICLALEDAAGADVWSNATSAAQSWAASHAVSLGEINFNTSHTTYDWVQNSTSVSSQTRNEGIGYGWRIPSVTDWRYIMAAYGGPSATSPVGVQTDVYGNTVREAINTACGNTGLSKNVAYWTCSTLTGDNTIRWGVHFQNANDKDVFWTYQQSENPNLRLVFAY